MPIFSDAPIELTGEGARPRPVNCLLSDCDGVIVDSEVMAEAIMVDVLQQAFGVSDLASHMQDLFGRRVIDIIRILESRTGRPQSDARRIELQREIDSRVAEAAPDMPGTLETYRSLGLPVAVVSNSAYARLQRCVERAGMLALVGRHLYSAEDVGRPKPAPDAYLYAAGQLGVEPETCLVIEDSPPGVRAGRAAGMRVVGFLGGSHIGGDHAALLLKAGAHAVFNTMTELPALIERLEAGVLSSTEN